MDRKAVLAIMLTLLLSSMLTLAFNIKPVKSDWTSTQTVYIRDDGSVDPSTAPISTVDNITYTFTGNIHDSLVVERDSIVIDGAGYKLRGLGGRWFGIRLWNRNNVTIKNVEIKEFIYGFDLSESYHLNIWHNNIIDNHKGIFLSNCSRNTLVGNVISDNYYNIGFVGDSVNHFMHSIDTSNLVNGKPVYYLINQTDEMINPESYPEVGYLGLINCTNITVEKLNLTSNINGLLLAYTNKSRIAANNMANNEDGISLSGSSNNTVCGNNVTNNRGGIYLRYSSNNNRLYRNNITANIEYGIRLDKSSHNIISGNNVTLQWLHGIRLSDSSTHNSIYGNNMTNNDEYSIFLTHSSSNNISGNNITANDYGMRLEHSSNNSITKNKVIRNDVGIELEYSSNYNSISGNNITVNHAGIRLGYSSNNTFRSNSMANNKQNFWVWGMNLSDFVNYIDTSNTVEGKPIYYLINKRDIAVPPDAGYVALVNCTRITVKNLSLTHNGQNALLVGTMNSTITKNNITSNYVGVSFWYSSGNTIFRNNISTNSHFGISLYDSSNNSIFGNNISNNYGGIWLRVSSNYNRICENNVTTNKFHGICITSSSYNSITKNDVTNNRWRGIELEYSSNNIIHHNNFVDNAEQVNSDNSANIWDDGYPCGGNYWSDYAGVDLYDGPHQNETGSDGIGDTPYFIDEDNQDNYPLMGMFYDFSLWYGMTAICNSTIYDFHAGYRMTKEGLKSSIDFNVVGPSDTTGFCRIIIPRDFMEGPYTVLVHNEEVDATELPISNSTHAFLYFTYPHSAHIKITEFPPTPPVVKATIDVDPDVLNLKSKGKWISAYIELPEDYDIRGIDRPTVTLNDTIPVDPFWVDKPLESVIGDHDNDGITDLMVKFDRQVLIEYIRTEGITEAEVTLSITGKANGKSFEATDTIKVIGQ